MNLEAIEAFARGAMSALLAGSEGARVPRRSRRPRRAAASASPRQMDLIRESPAERFTNAAETFAAAKMTDNTPISAPGAPEDLPAPPLSQAEYDRMEAVLRGESPGGYYKPSEGVAPWMESS